MSFDYQPVLEGELVELRPLRADDYDDLYAVAADPLIWEQHPARDRHEEAGFRRFFEEALACGGTLVAIDRESGRVIGSSRFHGYDGERGEVEIGWTFLARRAIPSSMTFSGPPRSGAAKRSRGSSRVSARGGPSPRSSSTKRYLTAAGWSWSGASRRAASPPRAQTSRRAVKCTGGVESRSFDSTIVGRSLPRSEKRALRGPLAACGTPTVILRVVRR